MRILSFFIISLLMFGLVVNEASAKRFGGGRSFGVYRPSSSFSTPINKQSSVMGARTKTNRWGGMLGGLLMGGLLASLFMHNGLAGGLLSWLLLAAALVFLLQFFRRRMQPGIQTTQNTRSDEHNSPFDNLKQHFAALQQDTRNRTESHYSRDFDESAFLRNAKVIFIRLQAAYDQKDLDDVSQFTTPEVLAEITLQFQERDEEWNKTEVITLEAALLDSREDAGSLTASVRFTGLIKENNDAAAPLDEIWHFRQSAGNWLISGVQQKSPF